MMFDRTEPEGPIMRYHLLQGRNTPGIIAWRVFQRVSRRRKPPHLIELKTYQRCFCNMYMTLMEWIETATEKANA